MSDVVVTDNRSECRFEAHKDGDLAGFAEYRLGDGRIRFIHTSVQAHYEGQGIGGELARGALDLVREDGTRAVIPECSFIRGWIDKHPDYQELVDHPG